MFNVSTRPPDRTSDGIPKTGCLRTIRTIKPAARASPVSSGTRVHAGLRPKLSQRPESALHQSLRFGQNRYPLNQTEFDAQFGLLRVCNLIVAERKGLNDNCLQSKVMICITKECVPFRSCFDTRSLANRHPSAATRRNHKSGQRGSRTAATSKRMAFALRLYGGPKHFFARLRTYVAFGSREAMLHGLDMNNCAQPSTDGPTFSLTFGSAPRPAQDAIGAWFHSMNSSIFSQSGDGSAACYATLN